MRFHTTTGLLAFHVQRLQRHVQARCEMSIPIKQLPRHFAHSQKIIIHGIVGVKTRNTCSEGTTSALWARKWVMRYYLFALLGLDPPLLHTPCSARRRHRQREHQLGGEKAGLLRNYSGHPGPRRRKIAEGLLVVTKSTTSASSHLWRFTDQPNRVRAQGSRSLWRGRWKLQGSAERASRRGRATTSAPSARAQAISYAVAAGVGWSCPYAVNQRAARYKCIGLALIFSLPLRPGPPHQVPCFAPFPRQAGHSTASP